MKRILSVCNPVLMLAVLASVQLGAQCPETLTNLSGQLGVYWLSTDPPFPFTFAEVDFGDTNPLNGTYAFTGGTAPSPSFELPYQMPVRLIYNGALECVYDNDGHLETSEVVGNPLNVPCPSWMEHCQPELSQLIAELPGSGCAKWQESCNKTSPIYRFHKVGINTATVPSGYKLGINGAVVTERLKVELCSAGSWCDYVFDPKYPLRSLPEVRAFIQAYRHLPGVPSAALLADSGGFELKATTLFQQEKIEELFLYLIQVQERIDRLNALVEQLETNAENE